MTRLLSLLLIFAIALPVYADRALSEALSNKTTAATLASGDFFVTLSGGLAGKITKTNAFTSMGPITASSVNGLTLTTSTGTVTIANGKVLTISNTMALEGTDGSTLNIGSGGTLGTAAFTAATAYQAASANLTTFAGIAPSANAQALLLADHAAMRSQLSLVPDVDVQAFSANLSAWALKTAPSGTVVGTSDAQVITGKTLATADNVLPAEIGVAASDETTAITAGVGKVTFRMPFAMTVTAVRASLTTASSSGTPTIDINEGGTTILSTKLTIDADEKTSTTAASAAVISDATLADDAEVTVDIDVAGTGATGVKIWLIGTK